MSNKYGYINMAIKPDTKKKISRFCAEYGMIQVAFMEKVFNYIHEHPSIVDTMLFTKKKRVEK